MADFEEALAGDLAEDFDAALGRLIYTAILHGREPDAAEPFRELLRAIHELAKVEAQARGFGLAGGLPPVPEDLYELVGLTREYARWVARLADAAARLARRQADGG